MASIPVVIFGIMRYIRIIYDGSRAETPERVILSDLPLVASVIVWGVMVVVTLYGAVWVVFSWLEFFGVLGGDPAGGRRFQIDFDKIPAGFG